jgi:predicted transcriptional regulator
MLFSMAKPRRPDYYEDVYHFICKHIEATGKFPTGTEIARGLNLNYSMVYNCLKVLESHGLIKQTRASARRAY